MRERLLGKWAMGKLEERQAKIEEARRLFHDLWTKEVGSPRYDKGKWMNLQLLLTEIIGKAI